LLATGSEERGGQLVSFALLALNGGRQFGVKVPDGADLVHGIQ
jgi:hypothetical protein